MKVASIFTSLIALVLLPGALFGGDAFVIKIATLSPEGTSVMQKLHAASDEIFRNTEGRIKFKIYPGGVMGNDNVVMRKMRTGQIHGSTFTAGGLSAVVSNYQILSLPLLFRNYEEMEAARKKIEPALTKSLEQKGYVSMGIVEGGFAYMMSSNPVGGPEDLQGRKVWIPEGDPIGRAVFDEANVPPVPLPLPDVLTGLQTGLIDTVASPPVATVALQWFTKVKYLTQEPLLYTYATFAFSDQAWKKISESDRAIVKTAMERFILELNSTNRKDNQKAMETLKNQGLEFVKIREGSKGKMQKLADAAIDKLVSQGQFDSSMLAQIRAEVNRIRQGQ